jgi:hypothetical protein
MSVSLITYPPSTELQAQLDRLKHWTDVYNFVKSYPYTSDWIFNYVPSSAFNSTLVSELFIAGLVDKDQFRGLMLNFNKDRPHAMERPDNFHELPPISDELFVKLASIHNWRHLLNYIKKHPEDYPYVLTYCNHSCYTRELLEGLVEAGFKTAIEIEYTIKYTLQCAKPGEFDTHSPEELRSKVESITNLRHIYNLMGEYPNQAHLILLWADPKLYNQDLFDRLNRVRKTNQISV